MNSLTLQQKAGRLNGWLLALMAFALPLSTSALSVLAILILLVWLVEGNFREKWRVIISNPVAIAVLVYLGLYVFGLLWTEDMNAGLDVLKKQWKLMLFPVFLTAVRGSLRRVYMGFFLAGMTVAMAMTYLAWFGLLQYADVTPTHLTRGTFHVIYNPLLAFAIYLLLHELLWGKIRGWPAWPLAGLVVLMIVNMFITEGRIGQLVFFVLLGVVLLQIFKTKVLWAVLLMAFLFPLIFTAGYKLSPVFHDRVDQAYTEVVDFRNNLHSSVGMRLAFWKNSWKIIKENVWTGVGTGDFQAAYAAVNKRYSFDLRETDNPHNQYILVFCQLGLLGLIALAAIFTTQIRQAFVRRADVIRGYGQETMDWQRIRFAFPIFFLSIMLTESYLIISGTGFLFSLFGAIIYARVK
jgi:O-antigen ligase